MSSAPITVCKASFDAGMLEEHNEKETNRIALAVTKISSFQSAYGSIVAFLYFRQFCRHVWAGER